MLARNPLAQAALILALLFVAAFLFYPFTQPETLTLSLFPSGKGSIALFTDSRGATLLANAGSGADVLRDLGETLPEWQRTVGAVILTDVSVKNAGGLPDLLRRYSVRLLIRPKNRGPSTLETAITAALDNSPQTKVIFAKKGSTLSLGEGAFLTIFWPVETPSPLTGADDALAFQVRFGDETVRMDAALAPRIAAYLHTKMAEDSPPSFSISSTTFGAYSLTKHSLTRLK